MLPVKRTDSILVQPENALAPTLLMLDVRLTDVTNSLPVNASAAIPTTLPLVSASPVLNSDGITNAVIFVSRVPQSLTI